MAVGCSVPYESCAASLVSPHGTVIASFTIIDIEFEMAWVPNRYRHYSDTRTHQISVFHGLAGACPSSYGSRPAVAGHFVHVYVDRATNLSGAIPDQMRAVLATIAAPDSSA